MEGIQMRKIICLLAVLGLTGSLYAADPFVGTWKMNPAKSKYESQAPRSLIIKIEAYDGGLKWTSDVVDAGGNTINGMWAGKYDSRDYPLTNNTDYDLIAAKKIGSNTFESVLKKGGTVVGSGKGVVSQNGKTLTLTSKYKNAQGKDITDITVLDKQ
jgi:hypothetical protein